MWGLPGLGVWVHPRGGTPMACCGICATKDPSIFPPPLRASPPHILHMDEQKFKLGTSPSLGPLGSKTLDEPRLFEVSWEACNRVGGIYTVLKTKAATTVEEFGDRYCLIGPYSNNSQLEFEPDYHLNGASPALRRTIEEMRGQGVVVHYGRWLISGYPSILLFELGPVSGRLGEWRHNWINLTKIPTPEQDTETNDAILFGYLVAWFLGSYLAQYQRYLDEMRPGVEDEITPQVIAHFHEWQVGVGLVLCRARMFRIATLFTTHATLLGRYLCAGDVDFYNTFSHVNADFEASKRQIYHRYAIEKAAAHSAHTFTTVSKITGDEALYLLGRAPDIITPNGLNVVKFSALHEFQNLHALSKEKIHDFVRGHFYGHYDFDLDNTLYFFTAGRYEYRNKGVDIFIESLSRLNHRLQLYGSPVTVIAFFICPTPHNSFCIDALKGQAVARQLRETVAELQQDIGKRIYEAVLRGHIPDAATLISESDRVKLKRGLFATAKRDSLPPVTTHNVANDGFFSQTSGAATTPDPILTAFRRTQLLNKRSDRVKVIFHPEFLSSTSPLLPIDYEDFVRGCHLGVFPSYYEPWGYTPAECTVMGVPSITTNLAGFGCYMEETIDRPTDYGIHIVDRRFKSVEESINQMTEYMLNFCLKTRRQRVNLRNRTERLADLLDWRRMGLEYSKARFISLVREYGSLYPPERHALVEEILRSSRNPSKLSRPFSAPPSPKAGHFPPAGPMSSRQDSYEPMAGSSGHPPRIRIQGAQGDLTAGSDVPGGSPEKDRRFGEDVAPLSAQHRSGSVPRLPTLDMAAVGGLISSPPGLSAGPGGGGSGLLFSGQMPEGCECLPELGHSSMSSDCPANRLPGMAPLSPHRRSSSSGAIPGLGGNLSAMGRDSSKAATAAAAAANTTSNVFNNAISGALSGGASSGRPTTGMTTSGSWVSYEDLGEGLGPDSAGSTRQGTSRRAPTSTGTTRRNGGSMAAATATTTTTAIASGAGGSPQRRPAPTVVGDLQSADTRVTARTGSFGMSDESAGAARADDNLADLAAKMSALSSGGDSGSTDAHADILSDAMRQSSTPPVHGTVLPCNQ
ncbi:glycogen(starch) synthase [Fonticula alba]|uniref:Glycogen [starch] synthase n=1 Tax=Fonticula alba TaxID=691883 RepID=A0A058ZG96_FONAL|nr:glycogen(starch) synthase [Fonticula alba]KCV73394.1 glycogen(starch) synthase [Fonticula alba]|eukprot:XP_009493095.1 glycogen(starch) synthase [Fonticula alba]